jgi:hypothetical protein
MTMGSFSFAVAAAVTLTSPTVPESQQLRITGRTTADATLIHDAVQEVTRFSSLALKCDKLTGIEASVMPQGWQPADSNFRIGPPGTIYERWDAAGCGRVIPFLIGFWKAAEGGSMFQVAHPFPEVIRTIPKR